MPSLALAKIIHHENPFLFKDVENARVHVRYIEGKSGSKMRRFVKEKEFYMAENRPYNPYSLPESYEEPREFFKLPLGNNNILVLSDIHAPYHNILSLNLAIDYGIQNKVNTILLNGDIIDNHFASKFQPDLRKRRPKEEFSITKEILRKIREAFPNAHIYWVKGNHDIRWEKWLMSNAGIIWDDDYFSLEERLKLHEEKIKLLSDKTIVQAGDLNITHGHYIANSGSPNAAKMLFDRMGTNFMISHLHRKLQYFFTNSDGVLYRTYVTGCLCEKYPNYNPHRAQTQNGFAHVTFNTNGSFDVNNIINVGKKLIVS